MVALSGSDSRKSIVEVKLPLKLVSFATPFVYDDGNSIFYEGNEIPTRKFSLFEGIAEAIEDQGIETFVPHRDVKKYKNDKDFLFRTFDGIVRSQLVLAYVGHEYSDVPTLLDCAVRNKKPIVYFCERDTNMPANIPPIGLGVTKGLVLFQDENSAVSAIENLVREFQSTK